MKTLSFELTMPNVGSWNGKWTGTDYKYFVIKIFDNKTAGKIMLGATTSPIYEGFFTRTKIGDTPPRKSYYYDFGDGWGANIRIEQVYAKEANKRRKISAGFRGYEWMIDSIIKFDEILSSKQIKERSTKVEI